MSLSPKSKLDSEIELNQAVYEKFSQKMYELTGVDLPFTPKNVALIKNRLSKLIRKYKLQSYEEYWSFLQNRDGQSTSEFISALTTNMTSFFREPSHFDFLKNYLQKDFKKYELRIWCAASSTGQEPYTIAMTAFDSLPEAQWPKIKILASDIDLEVLSRADRGFYTKSEMQGLKDEYLRKYFISGVHKGESGYFIDEKLRRSITFAQFNLVYDKFEFRKPMDIIFCRNVLIYFDEATTKKVINNMVQSLAPGGFLILGHSESGNIRHELLQPLSKAVYKRIEK